MDGRKSGKAWLCKNGHSLGVIVENGAGVPQLHVFRHAVVGEDAGGEVLGIVTGMMPVACDLCGESAPWIASTSAVRYLVELMPTPLLLRFWNELLERARKVTVRDGEVDG